MVNFIYSFTSLLVHQNLAANATHIRDISAPLTAAQKASPPLMSKFLSAVNRDFVTQMTSSWARCHMDINGGLRTLQAIWL